MFNLTCSSAIAHHVTCKHPLAAIPATPVRSTFQTVCPVSSVSIPPPQAQVNA